MNCLMSNVMDKTIISQNQLEELLAELPWKEKIFVSFSRFLSLLELRLMDKPQRELIIFKMRAAKLFDSFNVIPENSKPFYENFLMEFNTVAKGVISATGDFRFLNIAAEIEDIIYLMSYDMKHERRVNPRYPVHFDGKIDLYGRELIVRMANISISGMLIFCPEKLESERKYNIAFTATSDNSIEFSPAFQLKISSDSGNSMYKTGCCFSNPVTLDFLKSIILFSFHKNG